GNITFDRVVTTMIKQLLGLETRYLLEQIYSCPSPKLTENKYVTPSSPTLSSLFDIRIAFA
ncbi:hypothetical protein Dimus_022962, partial [Dionaea muscipula]